MEALGLEREIGEGKAFESFRASLLALCGLVFAGLCGCGGEATSGPEVAQPWFASCASSADCAEGSCRCGICSAACDQDSDCTGTEDAFCASAQDSEQLLFCSGRSEAALCLSQAGVAREIVRVGEAAANAGGDRDSGTLQDAGSSEFPLSGPSYCAESPVVWRSLELVSQADLDAMRGCEVVQGDLLIHVFSGADRSGLLGLREVTGELRVRSGGRGEERALDGLNGVEQAGSVSLIGLELESLEGLSGLRRVGYSGRPDTAFFAGNFRIESIRKLRSLAGLSALQQVETLTLTDNFALVDLTGASALEFVDTLSIYNNGFLDGAAGLSAEVRAVSLYGDQVADLRSLEGLRGVQVLSVSGPSVTSLNGLGSFSELDALVLGDMPLLTSLQGVSPEARLSTLNLQGLPGVTDFSGIRFAQEARNVVLADTGLQSLNVGGIDLAFLQLFDNPSLTSLSGLETLRSLKYLSAAYNSSLASLAGLDGITQLDELQLTENRALSDGADLFLSLEEVYSLWIEDCAFSEVALPSLVTVNTMSLSRNKSLASLALASLETAGQLRIVDNPLLSEERLQAFRTRLGAENLGPFDFRAWAGPGGRCLWPDDGICDETSGLCEAGTDSVDCLEGAP